MDKEFILVCQFNENGTLKSLEAKAYQYRTPEVLFDQVKKVSDALLQYIAKVNINLTQKVSVKVIRQKKPNIILN